MKRINLFLFVTLTLFSLTTFSQTNSKEIFFSYDEALDSPEKVKVLNLNNSTIDIFTNSNFDLKLPKLKVLKLNGIEGLELQKLLIAIDESRELEEIYLSGCELNYLPHQIGNFTNLKIVDVSNNNLRTLPYEIEFLTNLEKVDVSNNNLVRLNNKVINWSKLNDLNIANNDSLKQEKIYLTLSFLSSLQHLTIGGLNKLDLSLTELQNIEHLTIIESNFTSLPKEPMVFKSLSKLSIVNTTASELFYILVKNNIQNLELTNTSFSGSIGQFTSLKGLKISNSSNLNLVDLFSQFNSNKSIRSLSITSSGVEEIPSNIANFKALERLDLSRNSIKEIPFALIELKDLKTVNIRNNVINPEEIKKLKTINDELEFYWDYYDEFIVDQEPKITQSAKNILPPIAGVDVPNQKIKVPTDKETILNFKSGSSLEIPKDAFVDVDGNIIVGEVDIKFREFIDPVDFLVSGIPLSYDSAGVTYNFSSAGQIEIRASKNGQEVFPNPNSLIEVNMISKNSDPAMNMYVFDEDKENWVLEGGNVINNDINTQNIDSINSINTFISQSNLSLNVPDAIYTDVINFKVKKDRKKKSFKFAFEKLSIKYERENVRKALPELRTLSKYTWIYDGDNADSNFVFLDSISEFLTFSLNKFRVRKRSKWRRYTKDAPNFIRDISITPNPTDDNYLISVYMFNDTLYLPVYPDINNLYPETVQRRNKQFHKGYLASIKRKNKNWAKADVKYDKKLTKYEKRYEKYGTFTKRNRAAIIAEGIVQRSFRVLSFGILNCDQIRIMKEPKQLIASFVDENNNELKPSKTYVLDKSSTSIIPYANVGDVVFDKRTDNAIVLILDDGMIGIIDSEVFKEAIKKGDRVIKTKVISNADANIANLRRFI